MATRAGKREAKKKRFRFVEIAIGAALLGVLVLAWQCAGGGAGKGPSTASSTKSDDEAARANAAASQRMQNAPAPSAPETMAPGVDRLAFNMDQYRRVAVYPPWSRAFDEGTEYLLKWNKPSTADLPMDDRPGHDFTYHFDADRAHVAYGEAVTSWIEVWKTSDPSARQPIVIEESWLIVTGAAKTGRTVKLAYHDDGLDGDEVAGDKRYTNRFMPSSQPELSSAAAQVRLTATVGCCDGARRLMVREITYAPRLVAEIVGVRDAMRGGSLAVTLDVDVKEKGTFSFDANVIAQSGEVPIGYAQASGQLDVGRRSVEVVFFGRMFGEKGADGPYVVRDIRGMKVFPDGAEQNVYFVYSGVHVTAAYKRGDFSNAEWDSAEKRDKLAQMQKLIDQTKAGNMPPQPAHIHVDENGKEHVIDDSRPTLPPR